MTLMNEQRNKRNNQIVQQIKDFARAGQWQEAKNLVDTLPSTPDNIRLKERVEKQLYIATGEVPAVMEGSMALADADGEIADVQAVAFKEKVYMTPIPAYLPIRVVANLVYGIGCLMIMAGVAAFAAGIVMDSSLIATGITFIVSGLFSAASGSTMLMFVDIARNTFRTNNLLIRLLERDS
jgi:hypothetical protein